MKTATLVRLAAASSLAAIAAASVTAQSFDGFSTLVFISFEEGDLGLLNIDPLDVAIADTDLDGDNDLIVTTMNPPRMVIFRNNGDGTFDLEPSEFSTDPSATPDGLAIGDWNDDGHVDAATTGRVSGVDEGRLSNLRNEGVSSPGVFDLVQSLLVVGRPIGLASGDFNNNGAIDVAIAKNIPQGLSTVTVFRNRGEGEFTPLTTLPINAAPGGGFSLSNPTDIVSADFDGLHGDDLAISTTDGRVSVRLAQSGLIVFGDEALVPGSQGLGQDSTAIATADVNMDGNLDLIVANNERPGFPPNIAVLEFIGGNPPFAAPVFLQTIVSPEDVAALDLSNDGMPDIIFIQGNAVTVLTNTGTGFGGPIDTIFPTFPSKISVKDLNGDGSPDVVATQRGPLQDAGIWLLFNQTQFPIPGDLDGNGCVNGADLATLLSVWGTDGGASGADINGDGVVNGADLAALLANWGAGCDTDPGEPQFAMTPSSDREASSDSGLVEDGQIVAQTTSNNTPWIVSYFGFESTTAYITWLGLLDEETLSTHILELLELILNEENE